MLSPMGSIFKFARGSDHSGKGAAALLKKDCLPRGTYFFLGVSVSYVRLCLQVIITDCCKLTFLVGQITHKNWCHRKTHE